MDLTPRHGSDTARWLPRDRSVNYAVAFLRWGEQPRVAHPHIGTGTPDETHEEVCKKVDPPAGESVGESVSVRATLCRSHVLSFPSSSSLSLSSLFPRFPFREFAPGVLHRSITKLLRRISCVIGGHFRPVRRARLSLSLFLVDCRDASRSRHSAL